MDCARGPTADCVSCGGTERGRSRIEAYEEDKMRRMLSMIMVVGLMILGAMLLNVSLPDPLGTSMNVLAQRADCSADQRLGSAARHREAIVRARSVNTRQAQQRATASRYSTAGALGLKDDNGFEVSLRTEADGYMLFIRDATDPCSSGVFSDQRGVIYDSTPIR
jgi:hypothetical protein